MQPRGNGSGGDTPGPNPVRSAQTTQTGRAALRKTPKAAAHFGGHAPPVGLVAVTTQCFQLGTLETEYTQRMRGRNSLLSAETVGRALRRGPRRLGGLRTPGAGGRIRLQGRKLLLRLDGFRARLALGARDRGTTGRLRTRSVVNGLVDVQRPPHETAGSGTHKLALATGVTDLVRVARPFYPTRSNGKPTGSHRAQLSPYTSFARDTPVRRTTFCRPRTTGVLSNTTSSLCTKHRKAANLQTAPVPILPQNNFQYSARTLNRRAY